MHWDYRRRMETAESIVDIDPHVWQPDVLASSHGAFRCVAWPPAWVCDELQLAIVDERTSWGVYRFARRGSRLIFVARLPRIRAISEVRHRLEATRPNYRDTIDWDYSIFGVLADLGAEHTGGAS